MTHRDTRRPKVLVICDYYLPGYKSGGGMRTIVNTVARLSDEFDFRVVTRDHDGKGDTAPYDGIEYGRWNEVGEGSVLYLRPQDISIGTLDRIIADVSPSVIYLNSFFSTLTVLTLRLRKKVGPGFPRTILAPCGELSVGALRTKSLKKRIYIGVSRLLGAYRDILFKASCDAEVSEIRRATGPNATVRVAPDLPAAFEGEAKAPTNEKRKGSARFVFLSRISPKKNLGFLIDALRDFSDSVTLEIYGDTDDEDYLHRCVESASALSNITFKGPLPHELVNDTLSGYDFFVLPTLGENFGHVVIEALSAGCPAIISDTTPWNALKDAGAGKVLPLEASRWKSEIKELVEMTPAEHLGLRERAKRFAHLFLSESSIEELTRGLLREASSVRGSDTR